MKAITHRKYGTPDVLRFSDVDRPEPRGNEVLVRIEAASLNAADVLAIGGKPFFVRLSSGGLFRPRHNVPGSDIAGIIEACGHEVHRLQRGDRIVADLSGSGRGGFAEYVSVPEEALVKLPEGIPFEQAAAAPMSAVTALQALRKTAKVRAGDRVLIDGASGGVGTFAVQIAKGAGAQVTAVCGKAKADVAREVGADVVIPRGSRDPLATTYDVIYVVNGRRSLAEYEAALTPDGRFVMTGGTGSLAGQVMLGGRGRTRGTGRLIAFVSMTPDPADLAAAMDLVGDGSVRPVIDRTMPLSETARGLRYLQDGQARGKVVVLPRTNPDKEKTNDQ